MQVVVHARSAVVAGGVAGPLRLRCRVEGGAGGGAPSLASARGAATRPVAVGGAPGGGEASVAWNEVVILEAPREPRGEVLVLEVARSGDQGGSDAALGSASIEVAALAPFNGYTFEAEIALDGGGVAAVLATATAHDPLPLFAHAVVASSPELELAPSFPADLQPKAVVAVLQLADGGAAAGVVAAYDANPPSFPRCRSGPPVGSEARLSVSRVLTAERVDMRRWIAA